MVHAEIHDLISWLSERLLAAGHTAPRFHGMAHAPIAEREATSRAISLAELADVPILIVHVSAREAMEQIRLAKARGLKVYGETCPQYLFLIADDLDRPGFEGAKYMCSPPPRDKANQEVIWQGLVSGVFDVFSSDHAGYRYNDPEGKMKHGRNAPFKKVANGVPGLEVRTALLFAEGVGKGRIELPQFVALTATNAAKLYGLYPRKGTLAVGSDADLAIWDPDKEITITQSTLHDAMDYTPYEGKTIKGWPVTHAVALVVPTKMGDISFMSRATAQPAGVTKSPSDAINAYNNALSQFKSVLRERRAQINSKQPLPNLPGQALYLARNNMISAYKDLTDVLPAKIGRPNKFGLPPAYFDADNEPLLEEYVNLFSIMQPPPANAQNSNTPFEDVIALGIAIARAKGLDTANAEVAGRISLAIFFAETDGKQNMGNARSNTYEGRFQTGVSEDQNGQKRWAAIKRVIAAFDPSLSVRDDKE